MVSTVKQSSVSPARPSGHALRSLAIARRDVAAFRAFAEREGHLNPSATHIESGLLLARRIVQARMRVRRGDMPPEAVGLYETVPGWAWRVRNRFTSAADVDAMLAHLRTGAVSLKIGVAIDPTLRVGGVLVYKWVDRMRTAHADGTLSAEMDAAISTLPGWERRRSRDPLAAARSFFAREGHLRVPMRHVENGVDLREWLSRLLTHERHGTAAGARTVDWIAALDEMEPQWRTQWRLVDAFARGLPLFRQFVQREGHGHPGCRHLEDGHNLRHWMYDVRARFRRGKLEPALVAELNAIPLWYWTSRGGGEAKRTLAKRAFLAARGPLTPPAPAPPAPAPPEVGFHHRPEYASLLAFLRGRASRGTLHSIPPALRVAGVSAVAFLAELRDAHAAGVCPPSVIAEMASLSGWTWTATRAEALAVRAYHARHGHLRMPRAHWEGSVALGLALHRLARVAALEPVSLRDQDVLTVIRAAEPSWATHVTPKPSRFHRSLADFRAYAAKAGHAYPPSGTYPELAAWIKDVQQRYAADDLPAVLVAELERLPLWTWTKVSRVASILRRAHRARIERARTGGISPDLPTVPRMTHPAEATSTASAADLPEHVSAEFGAASVENPEHEDVTVKPVSRGPRIVRRYPRRLAASCGRA
jgi:hypothetical protein